MPLRASASAERPTPVGRAARTVGLAVLGSRILGLVREQIMAALFGASRELDAFLTAFRIPNLLRDLFAEGALSAAFVTTFTTKLTREGDQAAWRLANNVLNTLLLVVSLITLAGWIGAPWLVRWLAPGFAAVPGKLELTVQLTRIMLPFLLLVALAALAMGMLNAKRKFGIPASASMMFNLGSILGGVGLAFWFDPQLGPRALIGMSIGTLIGGAAQWLIQLPALWRTGYRYQPILDRHDPGLHHVIRLMGPAVVGVAAVQINVLVNTWFASYLENGAVTWLNCAFRLMQFPIGVFGVAIATATLPVVSVHASEGNLQPFRETLARSLRLALFLCLPAACGLAVLAEPIIRLLYEHGRFDAVATSQTAACLRGYAVGLAAYAAIKVIAPTFYALNDARTPALVSISSIALNALFCYLFAFQFNLGAAGLALSTSAVATMNFLWLLTALRRKLQRIEGRQLLAASGRIALASIGMTLAVWFTYRLTPSLDGWEVIGPIIVGVIVFGALAHLLRLRELGELLAVSHAR
ncbi:MAG: murein biosynthesis integral membrane protein MurJ [Verrucomicrobiae bacterium]|nr:murein biosynthesis integral membrane protein MurJ [Verrucomicrobiae bacterium]